MPDHGEADFYLEIAGTEYPLFVAKENGLKLWGDGYAPMLAPQVRTTGFGYEHVPPEIEVVEPFEDFRGGAGFERALGARDRYTYTRGIDLSWEREGSLALEQRAVLESDSTAIAAAPTKLVYTSLGLFLLAGAYIYKWSITTPSWVLKDDASAGVASYTDLTELDGVLYAARGGSVDYKYSTDGETWTAFTDADENADVFTIRGNSSDVASIWKINDNIIKATVNGANGGTAWAGGDEIGHTSEVTRSALTVDNDIYIFKDRGFYVYDGTNTQDLWKTEYVTAANGKGAYLWSNRKMYAPYGEELMEYDPYGDSALTPVYPSPGMDSVELLGTVTAIGGDNKRLYIAVKNQSGDSYIMKGRYLTDLQRWAWHTIAYLGAHDCNALVLVAPGIAHATNPAIVYGYGTAAHYIVLPRNGVHPAEDSACTFETTEGTALGPYTDFGARTFSKFLSRGMLLVRDVYPSRRAELQYEVDYAGAYNDILTTVESGLAEANEREDIEFRNVRFRLKMSTDVATLTPVVDAIALVATLNPRRKRVWRPKVVLSDHNIARSGGDPNGMPTADVTREAILEAVTKRCVLRDRSGTKFAIRLLNAQSAQLAEENVGSVETDAMAYDLDMVEIAELDS